MGRHPEEASGGVSLMPRSNVIEFDRMAHGFLPISIPAYLAALVVTAVAAGLQGTVGLGFSVVSVPILLLIDPTLAPVPQLLMAVPLVFHMAWRDRRAIDPWAVLRVIFGRLPGAALGAWLLAVSTARVLDVAVGVIVLATAATVAAGFRIGRRRTTEFGVGLLSGIASVVASMGGPPVALLFVGERPEIVRGNLAAIYGVGALISVAARLGAEAITWTDVRIAVLLVPGLLVGMLVAPRVGRSVGSRGVERAVLLVCAFAALALFARGIFGG